VPAMPPVMMAAVWRSIGVPLNSWGGGADLPLQRVKDLTTGPVPLSGGFAGRVRF
jgi:hypothetical protein